MFKIFLISYLLQNKILNFNHYKLWNYKFLIFVGLPERAPARGGFPFKPPKKRGKYVGLF